MYSMSLRNRDAMVMPARLMVEHEATADHLLQPLRSDDGQLFHNLVSHYGVTVPMRWSWVTL
jgi:hypothetical protein